MNTNIIANKDNNFSKNILILGGADGIGSVSYTHLTLPTIYSV